MKFSYSCLMELELFKGKENGLYIPSKLRIKVICKDWIYWSGCFLLFSSKGFARIKNVHYFLSTIWIISQQKFQITYCNLCLYNDRQFWGNTKRNDSNPGLTVNTWVKMNWKIKTIENWVIQDCWKMHKFIPVFT